MILVCLQSVCTHEVSPYAANYDFFPLDRDANSVNRDLVFPHSFYHTNVRDFGNVDPKLFVLGAKSCLDRCKIQYQAHVEGDLEYRAKTKGSSKWSSYGLLRETWNLMLAS